eukprot:m.514547 g.514547  ORF g.514547 m.514547 type:complete len:379 (+) comp57452_c0_seq1:267-1403(+)
MAALALPHPPASDDAWRQRGSSASNPDQLLLSATATTLFCGPRHSWQGFTSAPESDSGALRRTKSFSARDAGEVARAPATTVLVRMFPPTNTIGRPLSETSQEQTVRSVRSPSALFHSSSAKALEAESPVSHSSAHSSTLATLASALGSASHHSQSPASSSAAEVSPLAGAGNSVFIVKEPSPPRDSGPEPTTIEQLSSSQPLAEASFLAPLPPDERPGHPRSVSAPESLPSDTDRAQSHAASSRGPAVLISRSAIMRQQGGALCYPAGPADFTLPSDMVGAQVRLYASQSVRAEPTSRAFLSPHAAHDPILLREHGPRLPRPHSTSAASVARSFSELATRSDGSLIIRRVRTTSDTRRERRLDRPASLEFSFDISTV